MEKERARQTDRQRRILKKAAKPHTKNCLSVLSEHGRTTGLTNSELLYMDREHQVLCVKWCECYSPCSEMCEGQTGLLCREALQINEGTSPCIYMYKCTCVCMVRCDDSI